MFRVLCVYARNSVPEHVPFLNYKPYLHTNGNVHLLDDFNSVLDAADLAGPKIFRHRNLGHLDIMAESLLMDVS